MDLKENTSIGSGIARHPWERARAYIAWHLLKRRIGNRPDGQSAILDVGSGDLYQSLRLVKRDKAIHVIAFDHAYTPEISKALLRQIEGKNIELVQSLQQIAPGVRFSSVLLMDLMEHVEDDSDFLNQLAHQSFIGEDTVFLITVPAWQYLFSSHDIYLNHYKRYTRKQLLDVCRQAGLRSIKNGYFFFGFWLIRVMQFSLMKLSGHKKNEGSDLNPWKEPDWLAKFLSACLIADYLLCRLLSRTGIHLPGLSAYVLCRKK